MSSYAVSPWIVAADEKVFRSMLGVLLVITLGLSLLVIFTQLPEVTRGYEKPPPQFAELTLEKIEPKPVQETPIPEPPEPEVVEQEIVKHLEEPAIEAPAAQTVRQAREKAQVSGLLAFKDDFAEMREQLDVSRLRDTTAIQKGAGEKAQLDRSLLTAADSSRQANVNVADLSRETGGIALAGRTTTKVDAPPEEEFSSTGAVRLVTHQEKSERSIEKVRKVFDANKGAIYAIYNRALRHNPDLLGKIVLELMIEPDGHVSDCRVISTDMDDEELINKLIRRVQLFDFGTRNVAATRISYPVHCLPT